MSSDLYVFDGSLQHHHSRPEMVPYDGELFFPDPFSPFFDPSVDFLQEMSSDHNADHNPTETNTCLEDFGQALLSSSPPSQLLESLTLCQTNQLHPNLEHGSTYSSLANNGYGLLNNLEVKMEEYQVGYDYEGSYSSHQSCLPRSYSGGENVVRMMQRSLGSHSFDGKLGSGFPLQSGFDTLLGSSSYQTQTLMSSPDNDFVSGHLRRVSSTGDLQNTRAGRTTQRSLSGHFGTQCPFTEGNLKVGRYSAEERRERISKYRAKRNQRNFTKTIKYACRKTLADNRPRIRGRFARNDETGEIPKVARSAIDEQHDGESWFEGHEEEDNGAMGGGEGYLSNFGNHQFHQYFGRY